MSTEKKPVLKLLIPSPEADVLRVLLEIGRPATIKQIQVRLPKHHGVYHRLIRLRDRYKLVTRQKTLEKRDVLRRVFWYQPTAEAKAEYQQTLVIPISPS